MKYFCTVPVYCFMPDHQHLILRGISPESDALKAITLYKQKVGFLFSKYNKIKWQKDFYDHVLKTKKELINQVKYILNNPVRKGLAVNWQEYPFKGSMGYNLEDILNGLF